MFCWFGVAEKSGIMFVFLIFFPSKTDSKEALAGLPSPPPTRDPERSELGFFLQEGPDSVMKTPKVTIIFQGISDENPTDEHAPKLKHALDLC